MPEIPIMYSSYCIPQPELLDGLPSIAMHLFMAASAEGDEIRFGVITAVAAKFLVVNFQMQSCAAQLAAPAVPAPSWSNVGNGC
jgi:hypothetical protein